MPTETGDHADGPGRAREETAEQVNSLHDAELTAEPSFLRAIIEQTAGGLCVCHDVPEHPFVRFTVWNERMTSLTGYAMEDINRLGWYQSLYPDPETRERARARMDRMRMGENLQGEEWLITRADGLERMIRISTSVLRTPDGIPHVLALIGDVTEEWEARKGLETAYRELTEEVASRSQALEAANLAHRRDEEAHRQTSGTLHSLIQASPVGIVYLDEKGHVRLWNPAAEGMFGWTEQEVIGKRLPIIPAEKEDEHADLLRRVRGGDAIQGIEVQRLRSDGSLIEISLSIAPLHDGHGCVTGLVGLLNDISERKRAEKEQAEEKERAQSYLDIAGTILVTIDASEQVTLINRKGCEVLGYTAAEVIGENWFERFIPGRDRERIRAVFRQILEGHIEPIEVFENEVLTKAGDERAIAWHNTVLQDRDGRLVGTLSSGEDITERRRAEAALRESEERFREMAENINEVFWLFDWVEQRVLYASPAFESIWGRSVDDLSRSYDLWEESVHPEDREYARESFAHSVDTGGGEDREYRIVRPDGRVRWVSDRVFAIRDDTGQVVRVAGVAEDITERKNDEEERRRLQAKMQHAQKLESLGVMAGGIAHDFNNLLMAILGNADLALMKLSPEAPGRDYIENVENAAKRAAGLTSQMLAYSGSGRFVVRPIQLDRLVEEMAHLLLTVISKKADLQVAPGHGLLAIEADASQVRQIVMNLITNASEALGDEVGTVRVSTGVVDVGRASLDECHLGDECPEGRYVYLEVSDTGIGMDEETRGKIFDPFFTTKFTGRGLGLASVLGIVRSHHGTIRVDSEPGRGSSIRILFPPSAVETEEPEREHDSRPRSRVGGTVLVVDDDRAVLDLAAAMLELDGFRVLTASDGAEGVEALERHREEIDLVLLDMTMPSMSGEEAFRRMRRIRPDVRVILSSGYSEQDAISRFAETDLAGFIQKPYVSACLLEAVQAALDPG